MSRDVDRTEVDVGLGGGCVIPKENQIGRFVGIGNWRCGCKSRVVAQSAAEDGCTVGVDCIGSARDCQIIGIESGAWREQRRLGLRE